MAVPARHSQQKQIVHSGQQEERSDERQKEHQRRLRQSEQATPWLLDG